MLKTSLLLLSSAAGWAGSTALYVQGVTYSGPGCEAPVVSHMALAPHFLDRSYSMDFRVVIAETGKVRILEPLNGPRMPGEWADPVERSVYMDTYSAIAESVVRNSFFVAASCDGKKTAVTAVIRFSYDANREQAESREPCTAPTVTYKPPPPDDRHGPAARITVTVMFDRSGTVRPVSFGQPQFQRENRRDWVLYQAEYRRLITENLAEWKSQPAMCGGSPTATQSSVTFDFHWKE